MACTTTQEEMEELKQQFHFFDVNGSGWIEEDDLEKAFTLLGEPKDRYEIRKLIQSIDTNTDGRLSFDEYISWNRQLFIEDMKMKFREIDLDGNGILDKTELKEFALDWDYGATEEELDQLMYEMDVEQNDTIGIDEFIAAMARTKTGQAYYVVNGELFIKKMEADFRAIDRDGNGFLDRTELRQMAKRLSYALTEEELDALMAEMDENNDGQVSFEEFLAATVRIH